jgi:hypothetical protein
MIDINDHLKESRDRVKQLKNQKKTKDRREQEAQRKTDNHRHFIIGEMVCKYFPDVKKYQPQRTKAETAAEFLPLAYILRLLAANTELLAALKDEAAKLK